MSFPNQACKFEHDYLGIKKIINFALALVTYIGMKWMKKIIDIELFLYT